MKAVQPPQGANVKWLSVFLAITARDSGIYVDVSDLGGHYAVQEPEKGWFCKPVSGASHQRSKVEQVGIKQMRGLRIHQSVEHCLAPPRAVLFPAV